MWWDHRDEPAEPASIDPVLPQERPEARIGLALGGGAARGWAHIGVMRTLVEAGVQPRIMAGTSIGALVAGCYAAGKLDELEDFALSLTKRRVLGLLDVHLGGSGLIGGDRLRRLLETHLAGITIEELPLRFAAIATEFGSGHEVWLRTGPLIDAMRASYALPGVLDPVRVGNRWLMDGALVNPIPVTAARALGAETVVCVNLNGEIRSRGTTIQAYVPHEDALASARDLVTSAMPVGNVMAEGMRGAAQRLRSFVTRPNGAPGLASVMVEAFNITQDRIARSRLAGDPPDLMIAPRLGRIGLFEFHRAAESIALGREATQRALPDLLSFLETGQPRS
jgi:NTE family protein